MKIRTDFVTNSSSSSYITVWINNSVLAEICRKHNLPILTEEDVISDKFNGYDEYIEQNSDCIPVGGDFAKWFVGLIQETMADVNGYRSEAPVSDREADISGAIEEIKIRAKEINSSLVDSSIKVRTYWSEAEEASYWEETRTTEKITLKGFNESTFNRLFNQPLWPLVSENRYDVLRNAINTYGTKVINLSKATSKNKVHTTSSGKRGGFITSANGLFVFDDIGSVECTDKSFVTTGLDEKDEAMVTSMVSSRGGLIKSSVSGKTDYLIVDDDISWQTVKYKKAAELRENGKDVMIISLKQFYALDKR